MRYAELALMSLPFVLAVLWLVGLRHASQRAMMAAALTLAAFGLGLFYMGEQRAVRGAYVPARFEHGQVVPGAPP